MVIGAGSAGLVASRTAASLGARTLLIEADRFGGECLYTGCVPSKALIAAAHAAHAARTAHRYGVDVADVAVDFARVMASVRAAITTIEPVDSPEALVAKGVSVLRGRARLSGPQTFVVDGVEIAFRDAILATGSTAVVPDVPGADAVDVLTNDTFWNLDALPRTLLVQGGGPIGCEIAQAMARLGSAVVLVHRGDRLLPREDAAAGDAIRAALSADGVDVRLGTSVERMTASDDPGSGEATLTDGTTVLFDRVLAAAGRRARVDGLGLEAAGVALTDHGDIAVDDTLATSNPRIRAVGDVTPLPRFTHTAGYFGSVAASNAALGLFRRADGAGVPRVTFTAPEVGAIGVSPDDARARGWTVVTQPHHDLDRAIADGEPTGSTTLVADPRGRLRGALVIGPRAGEVLGELTTAIGAGLSIRDLASTMHAYPTYADGAWNGAVQSAQKGLASGPVAFGIRMLRRWHGRRHALPHRSDR